MAKRLALRVASLGFLLAPAALDAVTINATFKGTVTTVSSPISFIAPGDVISGSFEYESDAVDGAPSQPNFGAYPASNVLIQVGSYSPELHNAELDVFDEAPGAGPDALGLIWATVTPPSIGLVFWNIVLKDSSGLLFNADSLPTSLSLADFDDSIVDVQFDALGGSVQGIITDLTVAEPTSGILLLAALFGLGIARGRHSPSIGIAPWSEGLPAWARSRGDRASVWLISRRSAAPARKAAEGWAAELAATSLGAGARERRGRAGSATRLRARRASRPMRSPDCRPASGSSRGNPTAPSTAGP